MMRRGRQGHESGTGCLCLVIPAEPLQSHGNSPLCRCQAFIQCDGLLKTGKGLLRVASIQV